MTIDSDPPGDPGQGLGLLILGLDDGQGWRLWTMAEDICQGWQMWSAAGDTCLGMLSGEAGPGPWIWDR